MLVKDVVATPVLVTTQVTESGWLVGAPMENGTGATTLRLADRVAVPAGPPAALSAVTVQVPVPLEDVATVSVPLVPLADPDATPEQLTEADAAFDVAQLKSEVEPAPTVEGLKLALVTDGATTTFTDLESVTCLLARFVAVTVQVPVPFELVLAMTAVRLPLRLLLLPLARSEHTTDTVLALLVAQLKLRFWPTFVLVWSKLDEVTAGAATTVVEAEPVAGVFAALTAVTVQVAVPVPLVLTVKLPLVPVVLPVAAPEHDTDADDALLVAQVKVTGSPLVV